MESPLNEAPELATSVIEPIPGDSRVWTEGLTKIYRKRRVVDEVDLEVSQGEIVGLLGPNGAGKTTTFYMMVGLIPPDAGTVHLDQRALTKMPMYQRARLGMGYLAQEPSIFRKLSVEDNVLAILETLGLPLDEEKRRLEELLGELGLALDGHGVDLHLRRRHLAAVGRGQGVGTDGLDNGGNIKGRCRRRRRRGA